MSPDVLIRQATLDDIPELLRHRRGMYEDMGYNDAEALSAMVATCKPYLAAALANGTLHGWLACVERESRGWRSRAGQSVAQPSLRWPLPPRHHPEHVHRPAISPPGHRPPADANHD